MEVPKIITRLEKLQNSSKNLKWGHALCDENRWVLCCGHNMYRKTLTLLVREQNGNFVVDSDDCENGNYDFLCLGDEDTIIQKVILHLKEIFPELRRGV